MVRNMQVETPVVRVSNSAPEDRLTRIANRDVGEHGIEDEVDCDPHTQTCVKQDRSVLKYEPKTKNRTHNDDQEPQFAIKVALHVERSLSAARTDIYLIISNDPLGKFEFTQLAAPFAGGIRTLAGIHGEAVAASLTSSDYFQQSHRK